MSPGKELSSWQEGRAGNTDRQPRVKSKECAGMQVCFQSTRRNYVKFSLSLYAKHDEEVINICLLPAAKCRIDFVESRYANFIDNYLNAKDCQ